MTTRLSATPIGISRSKARAMANTNISFEFHTLGWKSFQDLCAAVMRETLGQTFQTFAPGNDGGRDGAFRGVWQPHETAEALTGSFTAQCKHTSLAHSSLTLSDLAEELDKAETLAKQGLADNYLLLTNHSVKGSTEEGIRSAFISRGVKECIILGAEWLSQTILENARLRMLVPRVYGLGDLSEILDERAYAQARQLFASLKEDLAKFVPTLAYRKAAESLESNGFSCLLGEPACGKSSIAAALGLFAVDHHGLEVLKLNGAAEFRAHWNPQRKQFIWVDDAFGAIQYQRDLAEAWNRTWQELSAALRNGTFVVLTSRDYIFDRARSDLKVSAFPLLREAQVVIRVQELTHQERREIVYNHLKLGDQPKAFRTEIKPFLNLIADHPRFLPEIARRIGNRRFTDNLAISRKGVDTFMSNPHDFVHEVVDGLPANDKSALSLIFLRNGRLDTPLQLSAFEHEIIELLGGDVLGVRTSLNALNGSLIRRFEMVGRSEWQFQHPTIFEAFVEYLHRDEELLKVYLAGAPTHRLFREVTCGDVGLKGAKVVVPNSLYPAMIERVKGSLSESGQRRATLNFISYRCDDSFLRDLITADAELMNNLSRFGSYMDAFPEVDVLLRLHEASLLSEGVRSTVVERVKELATKTPDAYFLSERMSPMLGDQAIMEIMATVRAELIPALDDTVRSWKNNYYSAETDVDSYFEPLVNALEKYRAWFDMHALNEESQAVEATLEHITDTKSDLQDLYGESRSAPGKSLFNIPKQTLSDSSDQAGTRDWFDDVDQ